MNNSASQRELIGRRRSRIRLIDLHAHQPQLSGGGCGGRSVELQVSGEPGSWREGHRDTRDVVISDGDRNARPQRR